MSEVESLLQLHLREKTSVYAGTGRWESLRVVQQASSLRRVEPLTQKSYLGCFLETGIANQGFASYNLLFEVVRCCRKLRTMDSWAPRRKGEEAPAKHRNRLTHKVWTKRRAEEFLKRL